MQEKNNLKTLVRYIKGVGPKKSEYLAKIGLDTIEDILYYLPKRYEDRSSVTAIKDLKPGETGTIQGEIASLSSRAARSGAPIFQAVVADPTGYIRAVWFNQPYLRDMFKTGDKVILYGKVEIYDKLQMVQPEYEIIEDDEISSGKMGQSPPFCFAKRSAGIVPIFSRNNSLNIGRIVPVYALAAELTQRFLRSLTFKAIAEYVKFAVERLPTYIIARQKLVDIKFALRNIHFPLNFEILEKAYKRIVFEEFFILQLALAIRKKGHGPEKAAFGHSMTAGELSASFKKALPFELTEAQKKAAAEIERDMSKPKPMNRLLEGDVGSGKTVVAAHALVLAVQNGFQGVVMAPTEVLARQHFIYLSELLMPLGINVVLLIGGMDAKTRERVYSEIKDGRADIVVGTHAIIQAAVEFKNLGLAVIDEQHKFGVAQRAVLRRKGLNPHVLIMTATPIPRTLALTVYGDLDISTIKELPKGRKPIITYWVEEDKRLEMYGFIREELERGRQAYVVCSLISRESGVGNRESAIETFEKLKNEVFTGYEVGLLHGKMSTKEKDKVMKDFKKGKIDLLVSTVVIEVGIDIPNASVMLIENADRFGLSQLHQLRGRIGRGGYESYCILLADPRTDAAAERLKAIEETLDGFEIAETDMDLRGPGEIFGTMQHGLPEIKFGNLAKDFGIMETARKEAFALIEKDPDLLEERHQLLKKSLYERFRGRLELIRVG
ncbi:MAG: ATP-dependent DNA helicase RecG [Candidatus Omnitrophota bacterium]|nr:ATP-dependent DNA helicase RecG [Candidatus Omnitrophota bacterium]